MIKREEVYKIGTFNKPHGLGGELLFTFSDDVFERTACEYIICLIDGILVPFFIEDIRYRSDFSAFVKLEGVDSVEQAQVFAERGRTVKLLGRGVCADGRYAAAVEPVAVPADSLEANVPGNFNLVTLDATTVGELKFYGQGAGSLPTGNAIVQDVLDCASGARRPVYDFSRGLVWDPELLRADYVFRTSAELPGAEPYAPGAAVVRDLTAVAARALLDEALATDPATFMAALS